jgi:iron(III) transport system permease protein
VADGGWRGVTVAVTATIRDDDMRARWRGPLTYVALTLLVAFAVLVPVYTLVISSFQVGDFGTTTHWGVANWSQPFQSRHLRAAMWNTITLSVTREAIALVLGVAIAWAVARTNLPFRGVLEFGFWIALFMPALPVALSWVLLAGGRHAILNEWLHGAFPALHAWNFNVYSWWGIVWVHLMTATLPFKVFLLTPAFRNMDAALEESARTCGTGIARTLLKIVVPIMLPTIVVVVFLGLIRAMQAFEIELVLGTPAGIDVYSTVIYRAMRQEPPLYGQASVLSLLFFAILVPFVCVQQWFVHRRTHGVIGGKFSTRTADLGRWRWPAFGAIVALLAVMTVVPTVMLVLGGFMKIFGDFGTTGGIWTLDHWQNALGRSDLLRSFANTLELGALSAVFGMALYTVIAYVTVKTAYRARGVLDFLTWIPTVIPGIVLSLGFLQMFLMTPALRPLYGTIWSLVIAVVVSSLTVGVQIVRGTLGQLSAELEEASWTCGASRLRTLRQIVLPLVAPAVIVVGLQVFATAVSVVGVVVLLGTGASQPLSVLQLFYLDSGKFETATIVGLMILSVAVSAAILARTVSARFGVARA